MKRNILISVFALMGLMLTSCNQIVAPGDSILKPDTTLDDDATIEYTLMSALQIDPMNSGGINLLDYMTLFDNFRLNIYREDGIIVAAEVVNDLPFKIFPEDIPSGKHAAYLDRESTPWALRLKEDGKIIATYKTGIFYIPFQLGCEEVKYELHFK